LAKPKRASVRAVIEKPFGHDLDSAKELNRQVNAVFAERQVFRIDHYLGKETVQNILVFRFANGIFEPVWNRNYIDHVQITAAETLGVEGRGPFYEKAGALRDVVQNHVMELLSFRRHGAADVVRVRERAPRKAEGLAGHPPSPSPTRCAASTGRASVNGKDGRLSRGRARRSRVRHRDLRRGAPGDRQLALGGRAVLSARRQAAQAALHRDQHPVQAAAAADLQPRWRGPAGDPAQPAHHAHPAG
jgi:hypothetical protein